MRDTPTIKHAESLQITSSAPRIAGREEVIPERHGLIGHSDLLTSFYNVACNHVLFREALQSGSWSESCGQPNYSQATLAPSENILQHRDVSSRKTSLIVNAQLSVE
jgi:hypothetical protein